MVAPVLTPILGGGLSPRIEVVLAAPGGDVASATLTRRVGNRTWKVRGGISRPTVGGLVVVDREAAFGVDVTYRAEYFDSSGQSLGFSDAAIDGLDYQGVVVSAPLEPSLWMAWRPLKSFADKLDRPSRGSRTYTEGSGVPAWIGPRRGAVEGVDLSGFVDTIEDVELFQSFLGTEDQPRVPVLLWRASPEYRLPPSFIAQVEVVENPVGARAGNARTVFDVTGFEVRPPAIGLVEPLLTLDDIEAYYLDGGFAAMEADNESLLTLERRYDLVGFATNG